VRGTCFLGNSIRRNIATRGGNYEGIMGRWNGNSGGGEGGRQVCNVGGI